MNRYVLAGAIRDAQDGKRVVLVTRRAGTWLPHVAKTPNVTAVRRTNGSERVAFAGGGSIDFRSTGHGSLRGMEADIVFLDDVASFALVEDATLVVQAAKGEVIRS